MTAVLVTIGLLAPIWVDTGCPSTAVSLIRCPHLASSSCFGSASFQSLAGTSAMVTSISTVRGLRSSSSSSLITSGTVSAVPLTSTALPDPGGAANALASPLKCGPITWASTAGSAFLTA
ncbi:hypothetical protein C1280_04470 [Gemmata obscuriglobus]|uniref:Uncharacterized protein n=1 Tax=Gemmata obscuriglobus TaxID=114 RepID=A0A2Z3GRD7_9BACT|nr:hypothetical protein C1280_04470 [Gemmata obscuriglobus]